ncbi:related to DRPLA protein [Fusarium torulosum]|uniref:Related to DRPLA protein n=1 Tax=Fusarium torulosum TaxID=33205 RepID=A0AAE8SKU8_9HYPO|nr:related to DRPLA protein [Fusarium torulosum]
MPSDVVQEPPAKKQRKYMKWSLEEDNLMIELQGKGMRWKDVAKRLPGRTAISCRLRYQNYLVGRDDSDEGRKDKLARLYERSRLEIWTHIAKEMGVPWQVAEAMHWQLGETYMARLAGAIPFSLAAVNLDGDEGDQSSPSRSQVSPPLQDSTLHGPGAPSAQTVFSSGLFLTSSPSSNDPKPPQSQCVLESGLAPIQNQPPPRTASMLPGVAELTGGVSPYSTHTAAPYLGSSTSTDRDPWYPSLASYSMDSAVSKRRHSPDQFTANQLRRIV